MSMWVKNTSSTDDDAKIVILFRSYKNLMLVCHSDSGQMLILKDMKLKLFVFFAINRMTTHKNICRNVNLIDIIYSSIIFQPTAI